MFAAVSTCPNLIPVTSHNSPDNPNVHPCHYSHFCPLRNGMSCPVAESFLHSSPLKMQLMKLHFDLISVSSLFFALSFCCHFGAPDVFHGYLIGRSILYQPSPGLGSKVYLLQATFNPFMVGTFYSGTAGLMCVSRRQ